MSNNKITADFFAPLLVELIQKQDGGNFSSLQEHIEEYKETRVKEDGYDLPASVKYFIEFMTTSSDQSQTREVLGQQHALQKHLLQEISKPENKELQTAVKTYSEDMIGQYFQRIEDLRVEKGFDDITSMYDASRQQADNGVLTAQIGNLTKCLINDFTGDDQELLVPQEQQRMNILQRIVHFFADIIDVFTGRNHEQQEQQVAQQGERIQKEVVDPKEGFEAIKGKVSAMQGELNLQQGQQEQSISQEMIHDAAAILENCQEVFTEIVEHEGDVRRTIVEGEQKERQTSMSLG